MSYLVLHMDKFKKEAIRGIQSHNRRERESHSNPDIDYDRSAANYELHETVASNYAEAIQNRIDDLLLVKAVRKDAVRMCGLIVTSDKAFFDGLTPEETRRFFEKSKAFLTEFVGTGNAVPAMVHMDEKTPHMHFLHVPVTPDGRLNANKIYTCQSLRKLQSELPAYLQSRGFVIERGVEQMPGSVKKHLDTREFKQQQEAWEKLIQESEEATRNSRQLISALEQCGEELRKCIEEYERQAEEAEKVLREETDLPKASFLNYPSVLKKASSLIGDMTITATQLKDIRQEFATLKPTSVTLDGNRTMSVKEAVFALVPTQEQMKKRGFDTQEIVERLHEKGIDVKPQTLTKYLTEARRQREGRKAKRQDTPRRLRNANNDTASLLLIYRMMNCEDSATPFP